MKADIFKVTYLHILLPSLHSPLLFPPELSCHHLRLVNRILVKAYLRFSRPPKELACCYLMPLIQQDRLVNVNKCDGYIYTSTQNSRFGLLVGGYDH